MEKIYKRALKLSYLFTFLVIFAGSFVRSTGSGMGCPDWPKCFGYWIPPTSADELEFKSEHSYQIKQMILYKNVFYTAKNDFTSGKFIDLNLWEPFTEHEYTQYNVRHTYTEYLNRLCGVLLGIFAFIALVSSLWVNKKTFFLNFIAVIFIGFEAWLGKIVVSSNLSPVKITLHMLFAIFILIIFAYLLEFHKTKFKANPHSKTLGITLILLIVQIILGTQVRELVDHLREQGMEGQIYGNFNWISYIHRSLSLIVFILYLLTLYRFYKQDQIKHMGVYSILSLGTILILIFSGALMWYLSVPMQLGPVHLVLSMLLLSFFLRSYFRLHQKHG